MSKKEKNIINVVAADLRIEHICGGYKWFNWDQEVDDTRYEPVITRYGRQHKTKLHKDDIAHKCPLQKALSSQDIEDLQRKGWPYAYLWRKIK